MISDFRSGACPDRLVADVCIIGAGPAGITLARELSGSHWKVCLLESGGLRSERDSQALNAGLSIGPHALDPATTRLRALGGATRIWGGGYIPLSSLEMARRDWVPDSGWPIGWDELAPYYARANRVCGIEPAGFGDGGFDPPRTPRALVQPSPALDSRICRLNPADFGQAHLPLMQSATTVHLVLHANLLRLQATPDARAVRRAEIGTTTGRRGHVDARCFVLATGGIENARLLLLSDDVASRGLGNAHDMVGRCFMDHPRCSIGAFHGGRVEQLAELCNRPLDRGRAPANHQLSLAGHAQHRDKLLHARFWPFAVERSAPGLQSLRRLRASLRAVEEDESGCVERQLLDALATDLPVRRASQEPPVPRARLALQAASRAQDVLRAGARRLARRSAVAMDRMELVGYFEQAPNRSSRITLSPEHDALAQRKVQVDWRLGQVDTDNIRATARLVGDDIAAHFGCRFTPAPWLREPGEAPPVQGTAHHLGTTRMSDAPREGVVDRQCRVHGVDNLYVAGSSVFPTGGWAFPTLTITALAIRLADELRQRMAELSMLGL